jgi:hypothetical protein
VKVSDCCCTKKETPSRRHDFLCLFCLLQVVCLELFGIQYDYIYFFDVTHKMLNTTRSVRVCACGKSTSLDAMLCGSLPAPSAFL